MNENCCTLDQGSDSLLCDCLCKWGSQRKSEWPLLGGIRHTNMHPSGEVGCGSAQRLRGVPCGCWILSPSQDASFRAQNKIPHLCWHLREIQPSCDCLSWHLQLNQKQSHCLIPSSSFQIRTNVYYLQEPARISLQILLTVASKILDHSFFFLPPSLSLALLLCLPSHFLWGVSSCITFSS